MSDMNILDDAKYKDTGLLPIAEKVADSVPVSIDDALIMLRSNDIIGLGTIANSIRCTLHGDTTYYGVNLNINYTNICELRCPLCAFSRDACDVDAYQYTLDEVEDRVRKGIEQGIDEVHIVGGLHPDLDIDYFEEMLRRIKQLKPDICIVAFTAVEYDYFTRKNSIPLHELFTRLKEAGLSALPGGGAEIFTPEVRKRIAPKKISGDRWIEIIKTAHSCGIKTNATMLFNHFESHNDIADHLSRLRALQDETAMLKTFVPLAFHRDNTKLATGRGPISGYDLVRIYATSRIFLHNVPHIKALWMYVGDKMAQILQSFGVDDIGATYNNEKIVHSAGATTPDYGSEQFLQRLITNAGFKPIRVNALYEKLPIKIPPLGDLGGADKGDVS